MYTRARGALLVPPNCVAGEADIRDLPQIRQTTRQCGKACSGASVLACETSRAVSAWLCHREKLTLQIGENSVKPTKIWRDLTNFTLIYANLCSLARCVFPDVGIRA